MIHFNSHIAKLSEDRFDWGVRGLCGATVKKNMACNVVAQINCTQCLEILAVRKALEVEKIKLRIAVLKAANSAPTTTQNQKEVSNTDISRHQKGEM